MTLYVIVFFVFFQVAFCIQSGGINIRSLYALKVSDGVFSFFKNYALSFLCTSHQINSGQEFYPEVNARLEKLLALALDNATDCGMSGPTWRDELDDYKLRIVRPQNMGGNTLHFHYKVGSIENVPYLLSPTVFILADKVVKKLEDQKEKEKTAKRRNVI